MIATALRSPAAHLAARYVPEPNSGCWLWLGSEVGEGYGRIQHDGSYVLAHRFSYELTYGPIPASMTIDHVCRNRACVNPAHLRILSGRENTLCGFGPAAVNARKTSCPNGHVFDAVDKTGGRFCRQCHNEGKRILYRLKHDLPGSG